MARYRFSGVPRRCPQCGDVVIMDVRGIHCSPTCRKAAYRRRLRQNQKASPGCVRYVALQ